MSPLIKMMGTIALGFIVCLEAASPLLAASRSHSVDVSCVVKPVFQISSPANKPMESVPDSGSLGGFQPTERPELLEISSNLIYTRGNTITRRQGGADVRIYTVTVL